MEKQAPLDNQNGLHANFSTGKNKFLSVLITILVCAIFFGLGGYYLGQLSLNTQRDADEIINQPISSSSIIDPPQLSNFGENKFTFGMYKNCQVYSRKNMNFQPFNTTLLLIDSSEVRCESDGGEQVVLKVLDKPGFETAKNNVYKIWKDAEEYAPGYKGGYKALLVDQNGGGSGEGIGKLILLQNKTYKLLDCFYYNPDYFLGNSEGSLSSQEIALVMSDLTNPS